MRISINRKIWIKITLKLN